MSLKAFHIVFVTLSSLLCFFFGVWSFRTEPPGRIAGIGAFACGIALIAYGIWFWRKIRTREEERERRRKLLHPLGALAFVWAFADSPAFACSSCVSRAEGPMIDAARLGVWLLFGLVLAVQIGFVVFFFILRKRAKEYQRKHPHPCWAER